MRKTRFLVLARNGLVPAMSLLLLLGNLSCSDDTTPSDVGPDAAVDANIDGGPDQGATGKLTVNILKMEKSQLADFTTQPAEGVTVAADLPGGKRVELTTGADGKVTFEEVAWSQGTATVTAHVPGHTMATRAGITEADGDQTLVMWPFRSQPMISVSGTAKNMDPAANYLAVTSDILGTRFEAIDTSSFDVGVRAGHPFTLYATNAYWHPQNPQQSRDLQVDYYGWTKVSSPGSGLPLALDVDFATNQLTPTKVTGTMVIPPTAKEILEGAWRVQFWMDHQVRGLLVGAATKVTEQPKGTFALEAEYIDIPEAKGVYGIYCARVSTTDWGHASTVVVDGYPKDGVKVDSFLDTPVLVKPVVPTQPIFRTDPIEWTSNDPGAIPYVLVYGQGRLLWQVRGVPGTTSITLPDPPSTAGEALATASPTLSARVQMRADFDTEKQRWKRVAGSKAFLIHAQTTKTITTTAWVLETQTRKPVEGAKICVKDEPTIPCATTDATGYFVLSGVPNEKDVLITMEKTGHFTSVSHRAKQQATNYEITHYMVPRSAQSTWEGKLGYSLDPTMGHAAIAVLKGGKRLEGATLTITPAAGNGVCYGDASGLPDPSLNATDSGGWGGFYNLPPGDYEVQVTHPSSSSCVPLVAWKGSSSNAIKVVSIADAISLASFWCE